MKYWIKISVLNFLLLFIFFTFNINSSNIIINTYKFNGEIIKEIFEKQPERVLSGNLSITELFIRLGLEQKLIGGCSINGTIPKELEDIYNKIPIIAKSYPKKEIVLSLKPDLIYSWRGAFSPNQLGDVTYWNKRGVKTLITRNSISMPQTLSNIFDDLRDIGNIFNISNKVEYLIDEFSLILNIVNNNPNKNYLVKRKVMLLDLVSNNKFLAWGEESLGGDIIRLLNAESSFKRNGLYSLEDILLANPDIIILWYMEDYNQPLDIRLEYLKNINILKDINAIRNNKIFPVHSSDLYNSGIRTIRGLRTIAEAIYPDLSFNN